MGVQNRWRINNHWSGCSLRMREHEFNTRAIYGDIDGANLLDWPLGLGELEPFYDRAEDKMGVTRTHGIPGLLEAIISKSSITVQNAWATAIATPAGWRSIANHATVARHASNWILFSGVQDRG